MKIPLGHSTSVCDFYIHSVLQPCAFTDFSAARQFPPGNDEQTFSTCSKFIPRFRKFSLASYIFVLAWKWIYSHKTLDITAECRMSPSDFISRAWLSRKVQIPLLRSSQGQLTRKEFVRYSTPIFDYYTSICPSGLCLYKIVQKVAGKDRMIFSMSLVF